MSPARFHHNLINGSRPSPLKVNQDSHLLQKHSSSSAWDDGIGLANKQPRKNNKPVIIYTHSPKVIHTQARDFMALVQKLTGRLSSSENDDATAVPTTKQHQLYREDNNISPILNPPKNQHLADVPLFTPTAVDSFYSRSPNTPNSRPSSGFEFIKGLPEYDMGR